jgi:hypothetical protein
MTMRTLTFSLIAILLAAFPAFGQSWGTIKGQVVWSGADIPKPTVIAVNKDQQHCLAKGPLDKDDLLIDAKTKGVKNVIVWLTPANAGDPMPINPALAAVPTDPVVIDQPMCAFVPRITVMRAGQTLIIKNSSPVAHNSRVTGQENPTVNTTIPPGAEMKFTGATVLKAEKRPMLLSCDIHGWMGGKIGVFDHPYFALTKEDGTFEIKDAPAGEFRIFLQHERGGWLHTPRVLDKSKGIGGSKGQPIAIPAGSPLDLGKFEFKPEYLGP